MLRRLWRHFVHTRLGRRLRPILRSGWVPGVGIMALGVGVVVVYLAVQRTLQSLAPAHDENEPINESAALLRLLLVVVACALVSTALVEFVERVSPLRRWFNRSAFVESMRS